MIPEVFLSNYSKTNTAEPIQVYYDVSPKKHLYVGSFSSLKEAVHARNLYEISLLASGNLKNTLKSVAKRLEKTLWQRSLNT